LFFGSVILKDSPLTAVQMLWVNLIMDTLAALALATEEPTDEILTRKPYPKDDIIVTPVMWRNVCGHSIYQMFILILIMFTWVKPFGFVHTYDVLNVCPSTTPDCNQD
jgi:Ca2+ transporting ATPase